MKTLMKRFIIQKNADALPPELINHTTVVLKWWYFSLVRTLSRPGKEKPVNRKLCYLTMHFLLQHLQS